MKFSKGFTLIEVMVVLVILGAILAVGLPKIRVNQNNMKKVARELSILPRDIRNQARIKNSTYRWVFKLDGKEDSYWVESAQGAVLIPNEEAQRRAEEKAKSASEDDKPKSPFQKVTKFTKTEKKLPSGIYFASIETSATREPVTQGMAYIYFSPTGLVEQASIQITDKDKKTWTLILNPLTGHADLVEKALSLKDLKTE